jgi:hypothetical protein
MTYEQPQFDIEPGVIILGFVYATLMIGLIVWLA